MATLSDLGLSVDTRGDAVALLVGPNGSGKSTFLRVLAETHSNENVIVVSNTPHDRFTGMRGLRRISAGLPDHTPANIVKRAVARSLGVEDSGFYQISAIMDYCGYAPIFGFRMVSGKNYGTSFGDLQWSEEKGRDISIFDDLPFMTTADEIDELRRALSFLEFRNPAELLWIDASGSAFEYSLSRDFAAVLRQETNLRRLKVIGRIEVMIQKKEAKSSVIEVHLASSGQLALISSLLFLITEAGRRPIILVDEPENSLHPNWQREYVDKLTAAMSYRDATIVIATHAPLVVTGALGGNRSEISVFRMLMGEPKRLPIDASASPASIEEILWEAFAVVTPANHFVSEEVVRTISKFEDNQINKGEVLKLISELEERSFDEKQKRFFGAVRKLVDKVERAKEGLRDGDDFA